MSSYIVLASPNGPSHPKKDVQERELSLIREYETRLLALEEDNAARDLSTSTATSELSCVSLR